MAVTRLKIHQLTDGTDGELITWDASGVPTTVAVGTAGHVLTSNGVGAAPTFQASISGGNGIYGSSDTIFPNAVATVTTNSTFKFNWSNTNYAYYMNDDPDGRGLYLSSRDDKQKMNFLDIGINIETDIHSTNVPTGILIASPAAVGANQTTGDLKFIYTQGEFIPTSGTSTYTELTLNPLINQMGGASGASVGLQIAPTLAAVGSGGFTGIKVAASGQTALHTTAGLVKFDLGTDANYDIFYRGTDGALARLPIGTTAGHVLTTNGTGAAPSWTAAPSAVTIDVSNDNLNGAVVYPVWTSGASGSQALKISTTKISFTPLTGELTASTFIGNLTGNASGTAANVTGTVAIANGGTGQTTAPNAINALVPTQTGNSGKFLTTNGAVVSWGTAAGGLVDGDYGDITVSGTGTIMTIDNLAVTNAKINDVSAAKFTSGIIPATVIVEAGGTTRFDVTYHLGSVGMSVSSNTNKAFIKSQDGEQSVEVNNTSVDIKSGTGLLTFIDEVLRIYETDQTNSVGIKAPTLSADYTLTLPTTDGDANQVLTTDGSGVLSWTTPSTASGDITNGGNTTGAAITIGTNDAFGLNFETQGVQRVNITGDATTGGAVIINNINANISTVQDVLTLRADSNNVTVPAAGYGTGILFQGESTTTDDQDMGRFSTIWTTPTHLSRTSAVIISGVNNATAIGEMVRFQAATAPTMSIASAMGTPGTTTYSNSSITTGVGFTLGNSSNALTLGGGSGSVTISTTVSSSASIDLQATTLNGALRITTGSATSTRNGVVINGGTLRTHSSGTFYDIGVGSNFAPTSGTATQGVLSIEPVFNQTSTSSGVLYGININPTVTSVLGTAYGIRIQGNSTSMRGIAQDGASTTNYLVGKTTFGATTEPTALVMLAAGTATASTAPLKFTSGTNLSVVENGAMEYNGTEYFLTSGGVRDTIARIAATQTLTNKRIDPRVTAVTASFTPDVSTTDLQVVTALAGTCTISAPTGSPVQGTKLMFRIKDNGTARTLTWNAIYRACGVPLPAITVASKTMYVGMIYNFTDTKWDVVSLTQEA